MLFSFNINSLTNNINNNRNRVNLQNEAPLPGNIVEKKSCSKGAGGTIGKLENAAKGIADVFANGVNDVTGALEAFDSIFKNVMLSVDDFHESYTLND